MKFFQLFQFFFVFQVFLIQCAALKILVYSPVFGKSHLMFMGKLADLYVKNGHDVVVFQPILVDNDPDLKLTGTKLARVIQRPRDFNSSFDTIGLQSRAWIVDTKNFLDAFRSMYQIGITFGDACKHAIRDDKIMNQLMSEKFDVAIGQFGDQCVYGLVRRLQIKNYIVASASPLPSFISRKMGLMLSTSYVPDFYRTPPIKMNFVERSINLFGALASELIFSRWLNKPTLEALTELYPDFNEANSINEASYIFVNTDEFLEFPQINIGGFGQDVIEPLNDEFKQILDSSKRGVVVVSFGTIARSFTMPPETKKAFLDAFSDYPDVTFLWKYERPEDDVAKDYPNVRTAKWLPQAALLNHTKTIGLMMHGGMNTIAESAAYGVPMVCIALFADQTRNSRMLEERGIGVGMNKHDLNRETISAALNKIINDKSYYQNSKQLAKIIAAKPETANQRVLRYTEFAAKFDPNDTWTTPNDPSLYDGCICCGDYPVKMQCERSTTTVLPTTSTEITTTPMESTTAESLTCPVLTGYWGGKFKNLKTTGRVFDAELQIQIAYKNGRMYLTQQFFNKTLAGTDSYRYHMLSGTAEESCEVGTNCSVPVQFQPNRRKPTADDYEPPPGNQEPTDAPEPSIPPVIPEATTDMQIVPPDQPTLPFEPTTELQLNITQEIGQATTDIVFNVTTEDPPALPPKETTQWQQTTDKWEPTNLTTGQPPLDKTTGSDDLTTGWAQTTGNDFLTTGQPPLDQTTGKDDLTTGWEMTTENDDYPDLTTGVSARQTEPNDYPDLTTDTPLEMTTDLPLVEGFNFNAETAKKTTRKVLTVTEYTDCLRGFRLATDNADPASIQIKKKFGGFFIEDAECRDYCRDIRSIKCVGFMYEPEASGKCTLFENIFNGYDTRQDSDASFFSRMDLLSQQKEFLKRQARAIDTTPKPSANSTHTTYVPVDNRQKKKKPKPQTDGDSAKISAANAANFSTLHQIVEFMKKRHLNQNGWGLTLTEILEEMQLDSLSKKSIDWLHQTLPTNVRLTAQVDNEVIKFAYRPPHKIKNRNGLIALLKKYHADGKGALLLSELSDSIPNAAKVVESLGNIVIDVPTQVNKRRDHSYFYNDPETDYKIDEEFVSLWRNVHVDHIDDNKIAEYLQKHGITSVKELVPHRTNNVPKRKMHKQRRDEERRHLLDGCARLEPQTPEALEEGSLKSMSAVACRRRCQQLEPKVGPIERRRRARLLKRFYEEQEELLDLYERDAQMLRHVDTQELIRQGQLERKEQLRGDRHFATIVFVSNIVIFSGNLTASVLSGSFSIISVFIDSMIDLLSSVIVHMTIWAINNTDKFNYPRGRHRLELMAVIGCSIFMGVANIMLTIRSIEAIVSNQLDPDANLPTIILMISSIFIKFTIMFVCYRHGTKNSRMLALDQRNDAITSIVGLAGAYIGDKYWVYADPVGAILVCTFVAWSWFHNAVEQVPLIVGKRMEQRETSRVLAIALTHDERIQSISFVSVYHVGEQAQVELHIIMDAETSLHITHEISETLRDKINALSFVEGCFVHMV
ncbi:Cation efflux family protein [Aphelenchoides bicaudatus]|nr:Cation efflux family protein [Aphelenchoides bicaudatus]